MRDQIFPRPGVEPENCPALVSLVSHPFGNYVLQTLLRRTDPSQRGACFKAVRNVSNPSNFGRSVLTRLGASPDGDDGDERGW